MRTTGSATGCVVHTSIQSTGVESHLTPADGDLAFFESELQITASGDEYQEKGLITFGDESEHSLRFSTLGHGHMAPGPEPGTTAGTLGPMAPSAPTAAFCSSAEACGFSRISSSAATDGAACAP